MWPRTFAETPRVGEFVAFSRNGKRDGDGVLHMETFRVTQVLHSAGNEQREAFVALDVAAIVPASPNAGSARRSDRRTSRHCSSS